MAPQDTLVRPLSKADFAAFMATEPEGGRYEFVDGRIIHMPGGTRRHSTIGSRFLSEIDRQLDSNRWTVHGSDRGIEMEDRVRYLDVVVDNNSDDDLSRWTQLPRLAVEVLSPSTDDVDLGPKAREYKGIGSLEAYIVAEPDEPRCYLWVRDAEGQFPAEPVEVSGASGVIVVPALGLAIKLAEVYRHNLRRP